MSAATGRRPRLLVVGSGSEQRNSGMLTGLARAASVILLQPGPVTWQRPLVEHAIEFDPSDLDSLDATLCGLVDTTLDGVLSYDETTLTLAARIGRRLAVGAIPVAAAAVVRDKHAQRKALLDAPLVPVRSSLVGDLAEARAAAHEIGYPVVLKPRSLSGSLGVMIATNPRELAERFRATSATDGRGLPILPGVLVEEFIDGVEFSVDCWTLDGEAEPLFTGRIEKAYHPRAINVGCIVGRGIAPQHVVESVEAAACVAALACGLDRTVVNVDLRWSEQGARVLEVNGRPAGEFLPDLAAMASGLDVSAGVALVAAGHRPPPRPPVVRAAGVAFLSSRSSLRFRELRVPQHLADLAHEVRVGVAPGDAVHSPLVDSWSRVGLAVLTGTDADAVASKSAVFRAGVEVLGDELSQEGRRGGTSAPKAT